MVTPVVQRLSAFLQTMLLDFAARSRCSSTSVRSGVVGVSLKKGKGREILCGSRGAGENLRGEWAEKQTGFYLRTVKKFLNEFVF